MVKPILSNLIMELNWMALLLKVRHREKQWIPTWYLHTQCIVLQTSTPNVKMENLPAHLFQVKITPEVYIGVSLAHINQKCVTIIDLKKIIQSQITNLIFFSGNCSNSGHVQCPGSFKCIPKSYLCDGDNDCRDNSQSDEQGCR